jgi:hypothetical protein
MKNLRSMAWSIYHLMTNGMGIEGQAMYMTYSSGSIERVDYVRDPATDYYLAVVTPRGDGLPPWIGIFANEEMAKDGSFPIMRVVVVKGEVFTRLDKPFYPVGHKVAKLGLRLANVADVYNDQP